MKGETMDYTMVTTTSTVSYSTGAASTYSSFTPYMNSSSPSGEKASVMTTLSYSGSPSNLPPPPPPQVPAFQPLVVRPVHEDYKADSYHQRYARSPYPASSPTFSSTSSHHHHEDVEGKGEMTSASPRSSLGHSPLPISPSAIKPPPSPEQKTINYDELKLKINYKKFERECVMEFDGDTVLCRVCGDKASGFHYGVHACEGCKGFFRRSIQQKIQYRPCLKNQQCNIMRVNRNRCQYCRLKKCISVGMSRDAVRFGRVPKKEKAKILEQMQKVNQQSQNHLLNSALDQDPAHFVQKIVDAHLAICPFSRTKFAEFYEKAWSDPKYMDCPSHMACPLKPMTEESNGDGNQWEDFTDTFTPAIRNVVSFAKQIPGFTVFNQEDQVTLLKAGTFEVLLLHLACLFDNNTGTMMFTSGRLFRRPAPASMGNNGGAGFLLDSMFDFAQRLLELKLSDDELALFCALVVISADRPGLRSVEHIERVQNRVSSSLHALMERKHTDDPSVFSRLLSLIPDLRTLNTLHSEKLGNLIVPEQRLQDAAPKSLDNPPPPPPVAVHPNPSGPAVPAAPLFSGCPLSSSAPSSNPQVVLQTSLGTFHRTSPSMPRSNHSSPDPIEMDMPPAAGHSQPSPPALMPLSDEPRIPVPLVKPDLESMQADMHCKMAQLYNLWEFDMRANRSNSLSSTGSTESSASTDSAYRSAPATPPRSALAMETSDSTEATSATSSASVLKQALAMPPLVAQHTWFHQSPAPPPASSRHPREDLHRSVLELSRRAAHEAMKGSAPPPTAPPLHPAAAAAAMIYQQQQQQYAAAMHQYMQLPHPLSAPRTSVPLSPPISAYHPTAVDTSPLNLSTSKPSSPLSPNAKVKVEPI